MLQTRHIILVIILTGALTNIKAQPNEITYLGPDKFQIQHQSEDNAVLIDLSSKIKYNTEHIPGAIGIHKSLKLENFADTIDREIPVYLYCDRESRSLAVAEYLQYRGFREVIILRGGIRKWKAAGLPVKAREKPKVFWRKEKRTPDPGHHTIEAALN